MVINKLARRKRQRAFSRGTSVPTSHQSSRCPMEDRIWKPRVSFYSSCLTVSLQYLLRGAHYQASWHHHKAGQTRVSTELRSKELITGIVHPFGHSVTIHTLQHTFESPYNNNTTPFLPNKMEISFILVRKLSFSPQNEKTVSTAIVSITGYISRSTYSL